MVHDQDVAMTRLEESTILYIYPMVDNDESEQNNTVVITEKNRAYESRTTLCSEVYDDPLQNLEFNYSEVYTEGTTGASNSEKDQEQGEATPAAAKDWSQASLECNKAYGSVVLENNAYESMTDSGTVEKYKYIQD